MRCALYRHFDSRGALLYVGITSDVVARGKQHAAASAWIESVSRTEAEWHQDRASALQAEAKAIATERPLFNVSQSTNDGAEHAAVAARIKSLRVKEGLNQATFAQSLGVKVTQYNNWETGLRQPSVAAAIKICETYGVTLDWLFRGIASRVQP